MKTVVGRPFPKGTSGNPRGRPVGAGKVAKLRATITEAVPEIVQTLIAAARTGDVAAAKVLLERALPALRPESLPAPLPLPGGSLSARGDAILQAVSAGHLGVAEAAALLSAIGQHARTIETAELLRRVEELEKRP